MSEVVPEHTNNPHRHWVRWWVVIFLIAFVGDQLSKWWIQAQIVDRFGRPTDGAFGGMTPPSWPMWLQWHHNTGVAWGIFGDYPGLVAVLTAVMIPILFVVWWRAYRVTRWDNAAWGLVLGGALGNAIDRMLIHTGHLKGVRDFIHVDLGFPPFHPWPMFNIADAAICVGVVMLLISGLRASPRPTVPAQSNASQGTPP